MSAAEVRAELATTADELGRSIAAFKESCAPGSAGWPSGISPYRVLDSTGRPVLAEMLAARGQVLAALAALS